MSKTGLSRLGFYLALFAFLAGCKLALIAVEGGSVLSASSRFSCFEGNNCVIEITSTDFNEKFTATPLEGYEFSHWLKGNNLVCGNSTDPVCAIDLRQLAGNEPTEQVIASDALYYLLPVFIKKEEAPPTLSLALQAKYDGSCVQCHNSGVAGAPIIHDETAWAPRLAKGLEALLASVKGGLGTMPPGGNCGNCSDDDYRTLITYMSGPAN
jgi:cytochrome c5